MTKAAGASSTLSKWRSLGVPADRMLPQVLRVIDGRAGIVAERTVDYTADGPMPGRLHFERRRSPAERDLERLRELLEQVDEATRRDLRALLRALVAVLGRRPKT